MTAPIQSDRRQHPDGQWLLIGTFRGEISGLIAHGNDPAVVPGGDENNGFQHLSRLKLPDEVRRNLIVQPVDNCVRTRQPASYSLKHRGAQMYSVVEPVVSGSGNVHAVWVWIGRTEKPAFPPPAVAGAWEWNLTDTDAIYVTYGPNIPAIYGRDWVVGESYPVSTSASSVWLNDMSPAANLVQSGPDRTRLSLQGWTERPNGDRVSIRAATEVVENETGRWWRGVTFDVTVFDPPTVDPHRAMNALLAREVPGWTLMVYWAPKWSADTDKFPILIARWEGEKVIDGLWVDPVTRRGRVHPADKGLPHKWANALSTSTPSLDVTLRLWGADEQWHTYALAIQRIQGTEPPAATIRITTVEADAVDDSEKSGVV